MLEQLIYLDQNIISDVANKKLNLDDLGLADIGASWAYSSEHFAEIRRSRDPVKYLNALDEIQAKFLKVELVDWRISGRIIPEGGFKATDRFKAYIEAVGDQVEDAVFDPLIAALNGGGDDDMLRNVPMKVIEMVSNLTGLLNHPESVSAEMQELIGELLSKKHDIKNIKTALGVGEGFNKVPDENMLLKIWDVVAPNCPGISCDQFFGFASPFDSADDNEPLYRQIIGCCAILDVIGFQAEKKCRKIDQIPNIRNDAGHIAMGAFCSALISADKRLVRRAHAIYEYKNLPSIAVLLESQL